MVQHLAHEYRSAADRELVTAIISGDRSALAEVLTRHQAPVLAFARRLTGDHARAEEICQDVFVRLWERSDRFDPERGSLRGFLLALTHGRSIDVVRSDLARRRREQRSLSQPELIHDVEARVVAETITDAVRVALARIPAGERQAIELAYFHGHSYRAVARVLDLPEGTVKSRIRSGFVRLRTVLSEQDLLGA